MVSCPQESENMPNCHATSLAPKIRKQTKEMIRQKEELERLERQFQILSNTAIHRGWLSKDEIAKIEGNNETMVEKLKRLTEACLKQVSMDEAVEKLLTSKEGELKPSEIRNLFNTIESDMQKTKEILAGALLK